MFENAPGWIFVIYYGFIVPPFCIELYKVVCKKRWNYLFGLFIVAYTYISVLINTICRPMNTNEVEYFIQSWEQGVFWTKIAIIGYMIILVWWIFSIVHWVKNRREIISRLGLHI